MLIKTVNKTEVKDITPQNALIEHYIECAFENKINEHPIKDNKKILNDLFENKSILNLTKELDIIYEKTTNYVENELTNITEKTKINDLLKKLNKSKIKNWNINIIDTIELIDFKYPIIEIITPYICPYSTSPISITIEKNNNKYIAYSKNLEYELTLLSIEKNINLLETTSKNNQLKENLLKLEKYNILKEKENIIFYEFNYNDFNDKNIINMCNLIISLITLNIEYTNK